MFVSAFAARRRVLLASVAVAALGVSAPVLAEIADGAPITTAMAAAADMDAASDVAPVDVFGRRTRHEPETPKYTAPLVDTPRSVTVIPQKVIEQTAAASLQDILRTSPGITFGAGEGGQPLADRPFIRGQSSGNNIFVDGVRDAGGQLREVFNLEQIEVVKGPDSAYSGRGSGGGGINLTSKRARQGGFTNGSLALGSDAYLRATADANMPINETTAVRFNAMKTKGDTPGREDADFDRWGAAASLALGLGTATRATLAYYHVETDDMPDYGVPLFTKTTLPRTASGVLDVDRSSFYGLHARDYLRTRADAVTLTVEHDFSPAASLRHAMRYSDTLNDYVVTNPGDGGAAQLVAGEWWMKRGTKARWNPAQTLASVTDLHGELTLGGMKHSYDLGLELSTERNRNANYVVYTTSGAACPASFANNVTTAGVGDCTRVFAPTPSDPWAGRITRPPAAKSLTDTAGVYLFDTVTLSPSWLLNVGLRYDDFSVFGYDVTVTSAQGIIQTAVAAPREGSWSFFNYQLGLVYKPSEDTSVYVSYGTASTPPTIAAGDQNTGSGLGSGNLINVLLEPEETDSFEVGAKAAMYDGRLALSAAAFHMTRRNAQIQIATGVFAQAGEVQVSGLELGANGSVSDRWEVFGGYTYTDSELVRGAFNVVNLGDPLANTPKHAFSLFTTYEVAPKLRLGGGAYYVSKSFGGNQGGAGGGANRIYAPSYWRFDAYAAYEVNDRASLQLNVNNLTDEAYIVRTNGVHHADFGAARQAIVTLNVKF